MRLAIEHETVYRYDTPVARSTQYLRLTPKSAGRLRVIDWQLELPAPASRGIDAYGNVLHVLTLDMPHSEIRLRAAGTVETDDTPPQPEADDGLPPAVFLRDSPLTLADATLIGFVQDFAAAVAADRQAGLAALMQALAERMPYTPGHTDVATSASEAFASGRGVCQDHAHVLVACARLLGVPARYVSGYLATDHDHVASHAWAEAWLGTGWLGYDVSNRCLAGGQHVKLAVGMDYLDACPVRGVRVGGGGEAMHAVAKVSAADQ
ncbi:transglutaminase family protein [Chitinimonas koreensis]|uniref:transglutaminase family protein n=1 Tax=Chitinimonas koreensis TaxID=356302 RepID=UPI000418DF2E|nr:transglutaminase family protein [Chitinimonas koreensis]QNM95753.1 transglutaminase family protein [Chitinimonas koreensis]